MDTKETVYDDQIAPLMSQIIEVCQKHKIAMLANFDLASADDPGLRCITALVDAEYSPPQDFVEAVDLLMRQPGLIAIAVTRIDDPSDNLL